MLHAAITHADEKARGPKHLRALMSDIIEPALADLPSKMWITDASIAANVRQHMRPRSRDAFKCWEALRTTASLASSTPKLDPTQVLDWNVGLARETLDALVVERLAQAASQPKSPFSGLYHQIQRILDREVEQQLSASVLATALANVPPPTTLAVRASSHDHFVRRGNASATYEAFLQSSSQWLVVHGPMRSGKSWFTSACLFATEEWACVAMSPIDMDWSQLTQLVDLHLPSEHRGHPWQDSLVSRWRYPTEAVRGLVIAMEADDATAGPIRPLLVQLDAAFRSMPTARVKVVLTCIDSTWAALRVNPPFSTARNVDEPSIQADTIELGAFDRVDMEGALRSLG